MFVLLVLLVAAAKNTLGIASTSSQHIIKIEQTTFLRYLCSRLQQNKGVCSRHKQGRQAHKAGVKQGRQAYKAGCKQSRRRAHKAGGLTRQVG
jgi:hypothetical protein